MAFVKATMPPSTWPRINEHRSVRWLGAIRNAGEILMGEHYAGLHRPTSSWARMPFAADQCRPRRTPLAPERARLPPSASRSAYCHPGPATTCWRRWPSVSPGIRRVRRPRQRAGDDARPGVREGGAMRAVRLYGVRRPDGSRMVEDPGARPATRSHARWRWQESAPLPNSTLIRTASGITRAPSTRAGILCVRSRRSVPASAPRLAPGEPVVAGFPGAVRHLPQLPRRQGLSVRRHGLRRRGQ